MKFVRRETVVCVAIAVALTWAFLRTEDQSPATPERPVLAVIAKLARTFLWLAVFAEPPAQPPPVQQSVSSDGYPTVSHERSL